MYSPTVAYRVPGRLVDATPSSSRSAAIGEEPKEFCWRVEGRTNVFGVPSQFPLEMRSNRSRNKMRTLSTYHITTQKAPAVILQTDVSRKQ